MTRDPFDVLGLSPDSLPADWKRAYRRLAMRWHPDRNTHPEATERFKEIGAAYERLLSQAEDSDASESSQDTTENTQSEASDDALRAADIRLDIALTLEEAVCGCRKTVHYRRGKACGTCQGSGEAGLSKTRFCAACHGSGRVRDMERHLVSCESCKGRGFFQERICPDCAGSGREEAEVSLEIAVPPGMLGGDELRLAGQGEMGELGQLDGHLYLSIQLLPHRLYQLSGRDICYRMPVSLLACLAGAEIEILTPYGVRRHGLTLEEVAADRICLKGLGVPQRGDKPAGDLKVSLERVFPVALSAQQRKWLRQAESEARENLAEQLPVIAEWWQRHRAGDPT